MKNKQRALVLAVLFITAIFIVNCYADLGTANTKTIVGFAGVPTIEFSGAKVLDVATVQVNTLSASELQSALETAKSLGLGQVGRAEIVDIATFVITPKKLRRSPDYIANEATTAKRVLGPGDYDFSILHDFNIDENRIYATGMSNGAQMCYRLVSKKKNLAADVQSRLSILTSYLLVSNQNVFLSMIDLDYDQLESIYYYPEYEIDLGVPLDRYRVNDESIYERKFEKGMVLVNPSDTESYTYSLDKGYNNVIPVGGGVLPENGVPDGYLTYESVNDMLILPPVSGVVLLESFVIARFNERTPRLFPWL